MRREEVIEIARLCGAGEPETLFGRTDYVVMTRSDLDRHTNEVERRTIERCAQLMYDEGELYLGEIIRALANQQEKQND